MKALVTGGTGFIGSHVVDLLLQGGHIVRLLSRKAEVPARWQGAGVKMLPGDLRHSETVVDSMTGVDTVFHIGEIKNISEAQAKQNVELVRRMASGLKSAGVKRLVFVSSLTVAGIPSATPADENTDQAVKLKDQYTEYKRAAEEIIRNAGGKAEFMILRPGIVYGPGSRYLGSLLRKVRRLGPIGVPFIGTGRNIMPLIHVEDLARAVYLAGVQEGAKNETLNLVDGQAHTWLDFFAAIGKAYGKPVRLVPVPIFLLRVPAVVGDLLAGLLGSTPDMRDYIDYLVRDIYFGNQQTQSVLGWEPKKTDLDAAVREMVRCYSPSRES